MILMLLYLTLFLISHYHYHTNDSDDAAGIRGPADPLILFLVDLNGPEVYYLFFGLDRKAADENHGDSHYN
jgi:hypothetical protein